MSADILRRGGSAVDATITALLCVGVVHAESSGIGGGGFMVVHDTNGSVHAINFRETAPAAATIDMYHSDSSLSERVCKHFDIIKRVEGPSGFVVSWFSISVCMYCDGLDYV